MFMFLTNEVASTKPLPVRSQALGEVLDSSILGMETRHGFGAAGWGLSIRGRASRGWHRWVGLRGILGDSNACVALWMGAEGIAQRSVAQRSVA